MLLNNSLQTCLNFALLGLDACEEQPCQFYGQCVSLKDQSVDCVCPTCKDDEFKPVCGTDGQTYSSTCKLKKKACAENTELRVVKDAPCGNLIILLCTFK